ncbi:hypothetical protein [Pseudomonas halotolerans]|uniref:hypothetical protein n=1 Tax=Pseudomonas halotolerans TaxID=3143552 RepID=UPI0031DFE860
MKYKLLDSTGTPMTLPFLIAAKESKVVFQAWAMVEQRVSLDLTSMFVTNRLSLW